MRCELSADMIGRTHTNDTNRISKMIRIIRMSAIEAVVG